MSVNAWKPPEDEALRALFAEGKTDGEIGRTLKRTEAAVERRRATLLLRRPDHRAWAPEAIERASRLWREGKSAGEIAKTLGGNFTRCGVLGKLHRLGLTNIERPGGRTAAPRVTRLHKGRRAKPQPRPAPKLKPPKAAPGLRLGPGFSDTPKPPIPPRDEAFLPLPGDTHRPWEERGPRQCKWPLDVDGQAFSCCRPSGERTYCETHARLSSRGPIAERARSLDDIGQWKRRRAA